MQQIQQIAISKLKRDPHQPRVEIDKEKVASMAVSIKREGVINPIEVDKSYTIITGELRWRAAKLAGLVTVPVKVLTEHTEGMERYIRQVHENLHNKTMAPLDTAKALEKIGNHFVKLNNPQRNKNKPNGTKQLVKEFGFSLKTLQMYFVLLRQPEEMQTYVQKRLVSLLSLQNIHAAPEEYRLTIARMIAQKRMPSHMTRDLVGLIKKLYKEKHYTRINQLLKKNYAGLGNAQAVAEMHRTVQGVSLLESDADTVKRIQKLSNELLNVLEERPLKSFSQFNRQRVSTSMRLFFGAIADYNEGTNIKGAAEILQVEASQEK